MMAHIGNAQKLQLYDIWKKEGHKFNFNLYKEFLNYCLMEALFDPSLCDKAFEIVEDLKADGFEPDIYVRVGTYDVTHNSTSHHC